MIKDGYSTGMDVAHCSLCKSFYNRHCHEDALCIYGANGNDPEARNQFKPEDESSIESSGKFTYIVKPVFSKIWRS